MYDQHNFVVVTNPIDWSSSYEMYGERKTFYTGDLSNYANYSEFKAKCVNCSQFTPAYKQSNNAISSHFVHCATEHGYVYAEDEEVPVEVADKALQEVIIKACRYELPLPGFDEHKHCVKQYQTDEVTCVAHEGNYVLSLTKVWLGYY